MQNFMLVGYFNFGGYLFMLMLAKSTKINRYNLAINIILGQK